VTHVLQTFLLRHGEAEDFAPGPSRGDEERELSPRGIDRLRSACTVYARIVGATPRILHSPLVRARQTAEILANACGPGSSLTELAELKPGGRAVALIDQVQGEYLDGLDSLVFVGHEPLLGDLLGLLTSGNDRQSIPMGKGMLAGVRITSAQVIVGRLAVLMSQSTAMRLA
jgi:phosphohistidine phosphatase